VPLDPEPYNFFYYKFVLTAALTMLFRPPSPLLLIEDLCLLITPLATVPEILLPVVPFPDLLRPKLSLFTFIDDCDLNRFSEKGDLLLVEILFFNREK
jgi:hypothetical protein